MPWQLPTGFRYIAERMEEVRPGTIEKLAWAMRVRDQLVRRTRNEHESTQSKFTPARESSLGGSKKKAPPKGRGFFV
jgi:hypothetical protein